MGRISSRTLVRIASLKLSIGGIGKLRSFQRLITGMRHLCAEQFQCKELQPGGYNVMTMVISKMGEL